jgi:preprotein translocase subunit SecE
MNRETKRQMARQGMDPESGRPTTQERRSAPSPQTERTGPRQYLSEVRGEMKKVAWPPREEIINSTVVVVIGLVVMTTLIFCFDWLSVHFVNYVFK